MDEADFFGEGVLRGGFVYKAHLRVPNREHPVSVVQESIDELSKAHDSCTTEVRALVSSVLQENPLSFVEKALPGDGQFRIKHPGARGGKWYRDKQGNIRYGTAPGPGKGSSAPPLADKPDLSHYSPSPLGYDKGGHTQFVQHLGNSKTHKFSQDERGFLDWWHDRGVRNLVEQYDGLNLDDLERGLGDTRFQTEQGDLSYEEAAHDFFASQDWGGADFEGDVAPILEDVMGRFHEAAADEKTHKQINKTADAKMNRWLARAQRNEKKMKKLGTMISSSTDDALTAQQVISALNLMDLVINLQKEGISAPNENLLGEGMRRLGSVLQQKFGKAFSSLASVQLMLAYIGASLNAIWDGKGQSYFTGSAIPHTAVGGQALSALAQKSGLGENIKVLKDHLSTVTINVANKLNGGGQ